MGLSTLISMYEYKKMNTNTNTDTNNTQFNLLDFISKIFKSRARESKVNSDNIWLTLPTVLLKIIYDYAAYPSLFEVVTQRTLYDEDGTIFSYIHIIRPAGIAGKNPIPPKDIPWHDHPSRWPDIWIDSKFMEFKIDLTKPIYFVLEVWCTRGSGENIIHVSNKLPREQDYGPAKNGYDIVCYLSRWNFLTNQLDGVSYDERKKIWRINYDYRNIC